MTAAEKVQSVGIGCKLAHKDQSLDSIRAAAGQLLSADDFHHHAEQLPAQLEERPMPSEVVRILEERFGL